MKIIKTNKDIVFWSFWSIWLLSNILLIKNNNYIFSNFIAIILFSVLILLQYTNKKFRNWLNKEIKSSKYKLNQEESVLWDFIKIKANKGYNEYIEKYPNWEDNICGPWVKDYTKEEYELVNKIHEYFYPGWYSAMPLGCGQIMYEMYDDIKNKVSYE